MQVYKCEQKVIDPKKKDVGQLKGFYDVPKPQRGVMRRKEMTEFFDRFDAPKEVSETVTHY